MRRTIGGDAAIWLIIAALLAGCAGPTRKASPRARPAAQPAAGRDGPPEVVPPNLDQLPAAEPKLEAPRPSGPNKPYEAFGQTYTPEPGDPTVVERGLASWYGRLFHGRRTASGEVFDMFALTAAHKTMPIPSYARVRNPANGREVIVRINDRGPFVAGRIIDLSFAAAHKLGTAGGVTWVEVERITDESIRSGRWRRDETRTAVASAPWVPVAAVKPVAAEVPESPAVSAAPSTDDPTAAAQRAYTDAARGFWLQLGAFTRLEGALSFQRQVEFELDWIAPLLAVFKDSSLHRLQAGPYATRAQAQTAADRLRAGLQLVPVIVERR